MEIAVILGIAGWVLALLQFVLSFRENKRKNEDELLEKTLGYFERGTVSRSMGISLVDGIWFQKKKHLDVIVPVLISQAEFLLTDADDFANERSNLIRLLYLIEKCLPYSADPKKESIEISNIILGAALSPPKIKYEKTALRHWFSKFNNGDTEMFDVETSGS